MMTFLATLGAVLACMLTLGAGAGVIVAVMAYTTKEDVKGTHKAIALAGLIFFYALVISTFIYFSPPGA